MRSAALVLCGVLIAPIQGLAEEFKTATGSFQVSLLSLHRQRDLMLVKGPWVWVDEDGHQRPIDKRTPRTRSSAGPLFQARLRISTEPQSSFRLNGPPTVTEAVDDLDQSLEAAPDDSAETRRRGIPARGTYSRIDLRTALSLPDLPGKAIKRLRGTVPVIVFKRSAEPLAVLSLSDAKDRSATAGDVTVTIGSVKLEPDQSATIALTARLDKETGNYRNREYQARLAKRLVDIAQQQIELVDDQTRRVFTYPSTSVKRNEVRVTLRTTPGEQYGAPDRIRVFGLTSSETELPFDFKNVPMP